MDHFRSVVLPMVALLLLGTTSSTAQSVGDTYNENQLNNHTSTASAKYGDVNNNNNNLVFLSIFAVVRFSNSQCLASFNYTGTCLTSAECRSEGGTASGTCASGFGVCCVLILTTCGSSSSRNCTYVQNPSALTSNQICTYTVNKCSSDICQIRLDYYQLAISDPDPATSVCQTDAFIITGATAPTICGRYNAGQHMYLDVRPTNSITLNFLLSPNGISTRSWNIKITQLPCNSVVTAPANCLQYYTAASGRIASFNYDFGTPANSKHVANQDYGICFRMESNYCSICYSVCPGSPFAISGPTGMSATNTDCCKDYLIIPGAYNQGFSTDPTMFADRLCGQFFNAQNDMMQTANAVVCTSRKPFNIYFVTDGGLTAMTDPETAVEVGFCLDYTQMPC